MLTLVPRYTLDQPGLPSGELLRDMPLELAVRYRAGIPVPLLVPALLGHHVLETAPGKQASSISEVSEEIFKR